MGSVNKKIVDEKVKKYMNSPAGRKKFATNATHYVTNSADDFIRFYKESVIESHDRGMHAYSFGHLGPTAVEALLENVKVESFRYLKDYKFILSIRVGRDMTRESLLNSVYGGSEGIYDLVSLLNNGYGPINARRVYGVWHGHYQSALRERLGAHFIERTIKKMNKNSYKKKYRIFSVNFNDTGIYKM